MAYVSRHTRLIIPKWLEEGDEGYIYALRRKRSDQKLKFHNSCEDLRAWVDDECLRTQHFIESMSYNEFLGKAPFGIFGRFIPITFLADFLCQTGKKEKEPIQEIFPVQESKKKRRKSEEKKPVQVKSLGYKRDVKKVAMRPIQSEPVTATPGNHNVTSFVEVPVTASEDVTPKPMKPKPSKPMEVEKLPDQNEVTLVEKSPTPGKIEIADQKPKPTKEGSFTSKQEVEDSLICLDLLSKYSALLCLAVNKLDEIDCALTLPHEPCICDEETFKTDHSFQEFFTNCAKALPEDSENSDEKPDSCCCCCSEGSTDESLPPTPNPSICPSVSCDEEAYPPNQKPGRIEENLLRKISIFQQRLNQIEEYWKDLNDEIKNSQEKIQEYDDCQQSNKAAEIRNKLQELILERICLSRQKCKALKNLKNLKLSACARFTKSDLAVTDKESNHFRKFSSCQCGFEEYSTSSSSEKKSRVSFSPIVRSSIKKEDNISQSTFTVGKSRDELSERKSKSETNILLFEKALKQYEKRISAYECLEKEVEILKRKAMQAEYYKEELRKQSECHEQIERESEEDKAKLCAEIDRLQCTVNKLRIELKQTSQKIDYWQGKDEEIAEMEEEAKNLKKELCRSQGDYEEEKRYRSKLELLIQLQRNEIERLMSQIEKMSKFMKVDKRKTEIVTCRTKIRSKSYSPDMKKCVQITDSKKVVKTLSSSSDEKQSDCCCSREDVQSSRQRIMESRASVKY